MRKLITSVDIQLKDILSGPEIIISNNLDNGDIYIVCRLGNDSQLAAQALRQNSNGTIIKDVIGGLRAWSSQINPEFPIY